LFVVIHQFRYVLKKDTVKR
jgi:hypothetical protein